MKTRKTNNSSGHVATGINMKLLSRVIAQPWAMRAENMALLTQMIIAGDLKTRQVTEWDGETRTQKAQAGYTPLNNEAWCASEAGLLPEVPANVSVILLWGILGRAWSSDDRWWFDPVEVDEMISAIEQTPEGSTVVLWFRSPGGVITGIPESAEALRKLGRTRRLLAFTDDLCASAAYWLASQCEAIHATPTANVGSIGVYIGFYDFCAYLEKAGVKLELFKAGRLKAMGMPGNPLSDEERAHLQGGADEGYVQFTGDVTRNRAIESETMQGQCLSGKTALGAVLIDGMHSSASAYFQAVSKGKV